MNKTSKPASFGALAASRAAATPAVAGFRPQAIALAVAAVFMGAGQALAQPSGAQAIHGQASVSQQGSNLVVTTQNAAGTNRSVINWQSFSIPAGSTTRFDQPNAASLSINRVLGNNPSAIYGTLSSNGRLVLVNPSGIAVGAGAVVDTAGFTASTLRMSDADALAGRLVFGGDGLGGGALSVDGRILARSGDVVLIAPNVQVGSAALVQSPNGATLLAAGQKVELTGRGLEGIRLELQAPGDQAVNLGTLQGDAVGIFAGQLKHSGLINATAATAEGGKVVLKAQEVADISGQVTASNGAQGGQVHATASKVMLKSGAVIDVSGEQGGGEALIGGGWQGNDSRITNAQETTVEAGASLTADATDSGNGGTIVAWSDGATRIYGSLSARGGAASGNGGNIETSGRYLDMQGQVDTRAANGATGTLLLDPTNIYIASTQANAESAGMELSSPEITATPFTPSGLVQDSFVDAEVLAGYLDSANVLVQTTNASGTGTGFIKVVDGVTWTSGNSLDLLAENGIFLDAPISGGAGSTLALAGGTGGITQAGSGAGISVTNLYAHVEGGPISLTGTGNAVSNFAAGSAFAVGGIAFANTGDLTVVQSSSQPAFEGGFLSGVSTYAAQPISLTVTGGLLTINDTSVLPNGVNTSGGDITLNATKIKVFGNPISAGGGDILIQASGASTGHSVEITNNGATPSQVSTSGTGTITINGNLTSGGTSGSAGLLVTQSTISAGSGAITLTGDAGWSSGVAQVSRGFRLDSGAVVTGAGDIALTGRAGSSASATSAGGEIASGATVLSSGGNVTVAGTLNNPSITDGNGLVINGKLQSGASALIALTGQATVGGSSGNGLLIGPGADIVAGIGGLTVTASTSSSTTATNIIGFKMTGGAITSAGNVALTGTLAASSASGQGAVSLAGGTIAATGAATITIRGSGVPAPAPAGRYDLDLQGTTVSSAGGEIKLIGDRMIIGSPVNSGAGRTMIVPFTASRPITLGGVDETQYLNLNATELNLITTTGGIVIGGSAYTGGITIGSNGGTINPANASSLSLINGTGGSITQTAAFTVTSLNADAPTVTLTNAGNQVSQISGRSTTGAFQFVDNKTTLTVGTVDGITGIASTGNTVFIQNTGDIALAQAVAGTGSGNTVVLAGQHFSNIFGAGAINPGAGRWLVYSTIPSSNTFGGLVSGNNAVWNAGYVPNPPATIASGNRYVFSVQPTVNVTATAQTKVYDATATFATPSYTSTLVDASLYGGVFLQDALTGALAVSSPAKDVGSYSIVQGSLAAPSGYLFGTYTGASATVTPASLTVTGISANNRVYDTTASASLAGTAGVTALGSDTVTVAGTGAGLFADKNVGTGKVVTVSGYSLTGADAGNYVVVQPSGLSADITAANLAVNGVTANNKEYDTTTSATLAGTASVTALGSDAVSVSGTGTSSFADKNVGTGKAVTVSGYSLTGADAGNYVVVQPGGLSADITAASLTVSGVTANNKVYDTTTSASLAGTASVTALGSDTVTVAGTGTGLFADKNVGTGKAVTVSGYTLTGTDAGNYVVVQPGGLSADITAASLTVSGITANNRVYDTTTSATLAGTASVTALGSDAVSVSGTGTGSFADKNVGTGKVVTVSGYSLTGADAGNYVVVQPGGVIADITAASLTVSGVTANNKVYDTTTSASLAGTASVTALGSDTVTVAGTGAGLFADKNVGIGKAVTVSGYTLTGTDAGNYVVVQPGGVSADITAASLTVSGITANNRVYDTTTSATLAGTASVTALGSDAVSVSGTGTGSFADKNVGTGKAVTVSGYGLTGADAGNYVVVQPSGVIADITPASLTVSGVTANNKVYDTTASASLAGTASVTALGSDAVTVAGTGAGLFADKNVGTGKAVTVSGYSLTGADAGNYLVVQPSGLSADITAASLTISGVTANNKTYDTTTAATLAGSASVIALGSDAVTVSGTGTGLFADKNVGTSKTVTVGGYSLTGADAGNYVVIQPSGLSADITAANLTVSGVTANSKVYDATTAASLDTAGATLGGVLGSDSVSLNTGSTTGSFADKNVGTSKSVSVSGIALSGADSGNYTVSNPGGVTADITAAALTVSGVTADSKIYDATTAASFNIGSATLAGVIGGDAVSFSGVTGSFADKNVGTAKAVTVAGVSLAGTDAGNYMLAYPSGLSADVTPASLTVSATNQTKTEGSTLIFAGTEFTSSGLVGGETIAGVSLNSAGAPAPAPAGSYSITAGAAVAGTGFAATNYAITYVPATLLVAAAPTPPPTAPPAPAPGPAAGPVVDQIVALGATPGLAAGSVAEMSASPLATFIDLVLKEEESQAADNKGRDNVVDDNQCRR